MSKIIKNVSAADITVATKAGDFTFPAGGTIELADDRADMVFLAGKWYFSDNALTVEKTVEPQREEAKARRKGEEK